MRFVGFLLLISAGSAYEVGGGMTWGILFMGVLGLVLLFPKLMGYLFEK